MCYIRRAEVELDVSQAHRYQTAVWIARYRFAFFYWPTRSIIDAAGETDTDELVRTLSEYMCILGVCSCAHFVASQVLHRKLWVGACPHPLIYRTWL